jgi:parvulin-like peptidyl-prolyl isomerase
LAKKQKKAAPDRTPTRHQRSKWQRQMRMRRIVITVAIVFLVGIGSWVGYETYQQRANNPMRQVLFDINNVKFDMQYFVNMIDAYARIEGLNSSLISYYGDQLANMVADNVINGELLKQGAVTLNITATSDEINSALQQQQWPSSAAYQDIMRSVLLDQKVKDYFGSQLPAMMVQADVQVVLVESQAAAADLIAQIDSGGNFTALASEFSCNSSTEGDLGWLPQDLMPNSLIADAAFNGSVAVGEISQPIYDETAIKDVGYWLIEVTDRQGYQINAEAMLLGSEAEAEQVRAELAAGGNFSSLAMEYSQDKSSTQGGQLGLISQGAMNSTAFDQVAFNLPLNQVSDPVKDTSVHTTGGYWLVDLVDKGYHEVSDNVKQQLASNRYNDWLQSFSNQSTINTYLDAAKKQYAISQAAAGL